MIEKAYAKLNLCLNVVRKRDDGYHELEMTMVPLALHDTLEVSLSDHFELSSNVDMPIDDSNTIVKAMHLMQDKYHLTQEFSISVEKSIPMQAGMAGGSADGAAMMRAINTLCNLNIPIDELSMLGKQIGADVPYCIYNQPSIVKGIGEKVNPFTLSTKWHVLLVKPQEGVSTKEGFARINFQTIPHPSPERLKEALMKNDEESILREMTNSLEPGAMEMVPVIQTIKQECFQLGLKHVLMSGSGSTVFAMSTCEQEIEQAYRYFLGKYPFVEKTSILTEMKSSK